MKKLIEKLQEKFKLDKKSVILLITGTAGVLMLVLSQLLPFGRASPAAEAKSPAEAVSAAAYEQEIEKRLCSLISSIDGAGSVKVMVTLDCTDENVYAKEVKNQSSDKNESSDSKYIIVKSDGDESGILLKVAQPEVRGVAVVCGGAGNAVVRREIISAVSAVLGVSAARVSVTAMKPE